MQIFNFISLNYISMDVKFNSNFLEANVLNIFLLLAGLIYVLKQFLGLSLLARKEKVLLAISESEERLSQANIRLTESEKQLAQTQIIIEQILKEAETTAQKIRQSILEQGKSDIERLTASSKISINYAENKIKQQIQQEIISLAISQVSIKLQNQMTSVMQAKIIDRNIMQLKGNLKV